MTEAVSESIHQSLISDFSEVRKATIELFRPLRVEDAVVQSDAFGSPANWHLAHVTWFFHKILEKYGSSQMLEDDAKKVGVSLSYLNSYYQRYGSILPKTERGKFPRPTVEQTLRYRSLIDTAVPAFLSQAITLTDEIRYDITLGIQHEMQHQELMIYDFQNYFQRFLDSEDNYKPVVARDPPIAQVNREKPTGTVRVPGGIYELGFSGTDFCYDNELPEHKVYLQPFKIDIAPVTNGDFIRFVEAGGYQDYKYWLSDGWDLAQEQQWKAPLYWEWKDDKWVKKDFRGLREIDLDEPVVNVSYYEADAYAHWAGKRLPTEPEWEKAASWNEEIQRKTLYPWGDQPPTVEHANLLESHIWRPARVGSYPKGKSHYGCHQMIGDAWEWTSSEYVLYPGFHSKFSEYTDKWAINQKVLRGGCFATPSMQIRNSYRNYFKPHERILFAGFRCVEDDPSRGLEE